MKGFLKKFSLFIVSLLLIFLIQGRANNTNVTFQDALASFNQYEMAVNGFLEEPAEEKIREVSQEGAGFWSDYYDLTGHQTFYNKLFRVDPILTEQEVERLEELKAMSEELDERYVSAALQNVYKASDFSVLIHEAKEKGRHAVEGVDIQHSGKNEFTIEIEGTFHAEGPSNILTRYFIIETQQGNYYWEQPSDYSMSFSDQRVSIKIGKTKYHVKGNIIYD